MRTFLQIRQRGYAVSTDGRCYAVYFDEVGGYSHTKEVRHGFPTYSNSCSANRINERTASMGRFAAPGPTNGFDVVKPAGTCYNAAARGQMIVRDRMYGRSLWLAYESATGSGFWILTPFTGDVQNWCGTNPLSLSNPILDKVGQAGFEALGGKTGKLPVGGISLNGKVDVGQWLEDGKSKLFAFDVEDAIKLIMIVALAIFLFKMISNR